MRTDTVPGRRLSAVLGVLGVGLCAMLPAGLGSPAAAAPGCARLVEGKVGVWTTRSAPSFPAGEQQLVAHTVDPREPLRQYATNGVSVMATDDGCRWTETFRLPDSPSVQMPASSATDRVLQVVVHPRAPGRVWLVTAIGQDVAAGLRVGPYRPGIPLSPAGDEKRDGTQTLVISSDDAGRSWTGMAQPPIAGAPGQLAAAPTSPEVLYLPTFSGLWASLDGGRTWQPRPPAATAPLPQPGRPPLDAVSAPSTTRVAVDPTAPSRLFGHNATAVRSSEDGGLTWTAYPLPPDYNTGPFVDRSTSPDRRVVVATQPYSTEPVQALWFLRPDGTGFEQVPVEQDAIAGVPWRAVWHPIHDELVMATWDRGNGAAFPQVSLYRADSQGRVEDLDELGLPPVLGLDVDDHGTYHLHTASEILTLSTSPTDGVLEGPPQVEMDPFSYQPPPPPRPAELAGPETLELVPGRNTEVTWSLELPRRPTPLDTYFLIDSSNSFEPDIQALADGMADVVRTLTGEGIDAHFGLGELGTREARRYSRLADIAAPGTQLQRGFEKLRTGGGLESHLIALHQTATGSGVQGTNGPTVPGGQAPTWRRSSLRTVVVITDVEYGDEDDPDAPTRRQVYQALADRGVRVIGLEVVREGGDDGVPGSYAAVEAADAASTTAPTPARADLEELAAATGAFAPAGGVDCRGNGTVEIAAGAPMVCTTTALQVARISTLADVLVRVLLAQVDERRVTLRANGPVAVTPTSPAGWQQAPVDVKSDQQLTFAALLSCRLDQAGRRLPLALEALVGGAQVAGARTTVQCGRRPATVPESPAEGGGRPATEPGPVPNGPPPPPPHAAVVPPVVPPVAPAPIGGSAPSGASAPAAAVEPGLSTAPGQSPAAAGTPAVAAGHAPEDEPQLAQASLQMVARSPELPVMQPWTMLAAASVTAAAAHAHHSRTRRQRPTVRNRTR